MELPGLHIPVSQDKVQYRIFLDCIPASGISDVKEQASQRRLLERLQEECERFIRRLTAGYIWHQEPFKLAIEDGRESPDSAPPCLHLSGSTVFADNIEDEWFIAWLLIQFSKRRKDVTVHITDTDGQFMLIEAANALPKWLTPENGDFRAYIRGGSLAIVPKPENPRQAVEIPSKLSPEDGLRVVQKGGSLLLGAREMKRIHRALDKRFDGFPEKVYRNNRHYFRAILPLRAARALLSSIDLISVSSRAYCGRDAIDIRASKKLSKIGGGPLVCMRVRATRLIYAQLMHQKAFVPRPMKETGHKILSLPNSHAKRIALEIGSKVAVGLEVAYQRAIKAGAESLSSNGPNTEGKFNVSPSQGGDLAWETYLEALTNRGWFKQYLKHSKPWKERLKLARSNFEHLRNRTRTGTKQKTEPAHKPAHKPPNESPRNARNGGPNKELMRVYEIISNISDHESKETLETQTLENFDQLSPDDSTEWMNLTPESLEQLLESRGGNSNNVEDDSEVLTKMAQNVSSFINKVSSHEGAEVSEVRNNRDEVNFDFSSLVKILRGESEMNRTRNDGKDKEKLADDDDNDGHDDDDYDGDDDDCSEHIGPVRSRTEITMGSGDSHNLEDYYTSMDAELSRKGLGGEFVRGSGLQNNSATDSKSNTSSNETDSYKPVNLDLNLVQNFLESYSSQAGNPGPTSSLLGSLGIQLPDNMDRVTRDNGDK